MSVQWKSRTQVKLEMRLPFNAALQYQYTVDRYPFALPGYGCGVPTFDNGVLNVSGIPKNYPLTYQTASFTCNKGYNILGHSFMRCLSMDGEPSWEFPVPFCRSKGKHNDLLFHDTLFCFVFSCCTRQICQTLWENGTS